MKITVVCGGGRKNGNGMYLINRALSNFDGINPMVKIHNLNEMQIEGCKGCFACRKKEICVIKDDMDDLKADLVLSDLVIFSSPLYMHDPTGKFMTMINRLYPLQDGQPGRYTLRHKPVQSMLIMTQGAPAIMFRSVPKRITKILTKQGFPMIGIVRLGWANELGAAEKNKRVLTKVDKLCNKVIKRSEWRDYKEKSVV